jgi:rRNA methylases
MVSKNQQKLIRQLEMKKYRQREGLFVAEGPKVVGDLLKAGFRARLLFSTTEQAGAETVTEDELRRISFLQHPQQMLAVFPLPEPTVEQPQEGRLYLALDGVQDPGNLGTIIRLADWFGIDAIYCSEDTADAWAPKVVQATMGSIARVKVVYTNLKKLLDATTLPVYGTLLDGDNIYREPLSTEGIIVMGNEGNGISADIRQKVTRRLLIPSFRQGDTAESLNVAIATAITCSEFRRRQD